MSASAIRLFALSSLFIAGACSSAEVMAAEENSSAKLGVSYTADGKLEFPAGYREWIYLSSGLDMNYSEQASARSHSMFDNVFADPMAYRGFLRTGTWPDKTLLVMEVRGASEKGSINKHGKFQTGQLMGVEVHVKDEQRFEGGWAFFAFSPTAKAAAQIPKAANCYTCHEQHAAVDTTFVQFYPTLLDVAKQKGTVRADLP